MIVGDKIVALWILFWQTNHIYCESCIASTPTVKEVKNCPNTTAEWQSAADVKQCQKMQSHNCKSFVYHCLMNEKENAFLEVCAPTWWMSGFCPMFNTKEERVIDNFELDCTSFKEGEKCPSRFISTEAYKYQKCYEHVREKIENNSTTNFKPYSTCNIGHTASSGSEINPSLIAAIVIVALLTVVVIVLFMLLFLARKQIKWNEIIRWKENTQELNSLDQEEESQILLGKKDIEADLEIGDASAAIEEINHEKTEPKNCQNKRGFYQEGTGTGGTSQFHQKLSKPEAGEGDTGTPSKDKIHQKSEKSKGQTTEINLEDSKTQDSEEQLEVSMKERNPKDSKMQDSKAQLEADEESTKTAGAKKGLHGGKPAVPRKPIIPVDSTRQDSEQQLKDQKRTDTVGTGEVHQELFKPEGQSSTTGYDIQGTCSNGNIPDDSIGKEKMKDPTNMEKVNSIQDNNQESSTEYEKKNVNELRQQFEQGEN